MTGEEMKTIRHELGLSTVQLGRAFGYGGEDNTASVMIRKYESGGRPIPVYLQRLLEMYRRHGVPTGWQYAPEIAAAYEAVYRSTSVQQLCDALNALKHLHPEAIGEIEIPQFGDAPDVDWSDWNAEPLAADDRYVLFREPVTGRIFMMKRGDVENGDDE